MNYFSQLVRRRLGNEIKIQSFIKDTLGIEYNLWLHHYNKGTVKREYVHKALKELDLPYEIVFPKTFDNKVLETIKKRGIDPPGAHLTPKEVPDNSDQTAKSGSIEEGSFFDAFKKAKEQQQTPTERPKEKEAKQEDKEEDIDSLLDNVQFID